MTWAFVAAACVAFSITVLTAPLVRRMAAFLGAMDRPDGVRKTHSAPTARLGGIAVALGFFAALIAVNLLYPHSATSSLRKLLLPSALILATGAWDDLRSLRPRVKLLFQTVAAVAFCLMGFRIEHMFAGTLPLALSLALSVAWLVACANAMNLFDGMDGLAPGVGLFAALMMCGLALFQGKESVAILAMCLAGGCAGFLLFNFPPALLFLGDSGSLFIGMLLGVLAIEGSFKSSLTFALVVPVLALGLPLADTILAVIRRVSRRTSIFSADKDHIHHRLVAGGFTRGQALFLLYGISICLASLSLLVAFSNSIIAGLLIVAAGVLIWLLARFAEADVVREFGVMVMGRIRGNAQSPPVVRSAGERGAAPPGGPASAEEAAQPGGAGGYSLQAEDPGKGPDRLTRAEK